MKDYTSYQDKWYTIPAEVVIKVLETDPEKGLTEQQISERINEFGLNELPPKKRRIRSSVFWDILMMS
ncbi:MAG: hypothetical protein LIP01_12475 [Tannerellaceae bacterium]|nr:hypothetical protein [Tannerellaceae bacterium]